MFALHRLCGDLADDIGLGIFQHDFHARVTGLRHDLNGDKCQLQQAREEKFHKRIERLAEVTREQCQRDARLFDDR